MSFFRRHFTVTKFEAVVIAVIAVVLVALLLPSAKVAVTGGRQTQCWNNLRNIALALHRYHDDHGSFPPAVTYGPDGRPWHSWRALLLPYFDDRSLQQPTVAFKKRYRFDEPWDSAGNLTLIDELPVPLVFGCLEDAVASRDKTTSYVAIIGDRTMWPPNGSLTGNDISDGPAVTIHVVERIGSGIRWTEPRDVELEGLAVDTLMIGPASNPTPKRGEGFRSHRHVAFADGSARYLPDETPISVVRSMLLRDDGGPTPEEIP